MSRQAARTELPTATTGTVGSGPLQQAAGCFFFRVELAPPRPFLLFRFFIFRSATR
jgi:hypothetical protein